MIELNSLCIDHMTNSSSKILVTLSLFNLKIKSMSESLLEIDQIIIIIKYSNSKTKYSNQVKGISTAL